MTFAAVVAACLGAFLILCWQLWGSIEKLIRHLRGHDTRISSLEVKDYAQDARLDEHRKHIIKTKRDIKELAKDLGWEDDRRATQVIDANTLGDLIKKSKEPPDEPPPNAA